MTSLPPLSRTDASLSLSSGSVGPASSSPVGQAANGWFDGMAGGHGAGLSAEAESQSRGLSATQHAERVLQHLVDQG